MNVCIQLCMQSTDSQPLMQNCKHVEVRQYIPMHVYLRNYWLQPCNHRGVNTVSGEDDKDEHIQKLHVYHKFWCRCDLAEWMRTWMGVQITMLTQYTKHTAATNTHT